MSDPTALEVLRSFLEGLMPRVGQVEQDMASLEAKVTALEATQAAHVAMCAEHRAAEATRRGWLHQTIGESVKQPAFWGVVVLAVVLGARSCGVSTDDLPTVVATSTEATP